MDSKRSEKQAKQLLLYEQLAQLFPQYGPDELYAYILSYKTFDACVEAILSANSVEKQSSIPKESSSSSEKSQNNDNANSPLVQLQRLVKGSGLENDISFLESELEKNQKNVYATWVQLMEQCNHSSSIISEQSSKQVNNEIVEWGRMMDRILDAASMDEIKDDQLLQQIDQKLDQIQYWSSEEEEEKPLPKKKNEADSLFATDVVDYLKKNQNSKMENTIYNTLLQREQELNVLEGFFKSMDVVEDLYQEDLKHIEQEQEINQKLQHKLNKKLEKSNQNAAPAVVAPPQLAKTNPATLHDVSSMVSSKLRRLQRQLPFLLHGSETLFQKLSALLNSVQTTKSLQVELALQTSLIQKFEQKLASFRSKVPTTTAMLAFHVTKVNSLNSINKLPNFMWYDKGIYLTTHPDLSAMRGGVEGRILVCAVVLGRMCVMDRVDSKQELIPGFDSHVKLQGDATDMVIYNPAQILPLMVVRFHPFRNYWKRILFGEEEKI